MPVKNAPRWLRRCWCWLFGCRPIVLEVYRVDNQYGTNRASSASLYCFRCDSLHGWNFGE